ncbi:hypothetical protein GCM10010428_49400 [Actinosynnema pretiosum subsp. pretiosum]
MGCAYGGAGRWAAFAQEFHAKRKCPLYLVRRKRFAHPDGEGVVIDDNPVDGPGCNTEGHAAEQVGGGVGKRKGCSGVCVHPVILRSDVELRLPTGR